MKIEVPKVSKTLLIVSSDLMPVLKSYREYEASLNDASYQSFTFTSMNDASFQSFSITTQSDLSEGLFNLKGLGFFKNIKDLMLIIVIHSAYNATYQFVINGIPFPKFFEILIEYIRDIPTTLVTTSCYGTEFQRFIYHLSPGSKVMTMCSWRFASLSYYERIYYLSQRNFAQFMNEAMMDLVTCDMDLCVIVTSKDLKGFITIINYNYEDLETYYKQRNCIYTFSKTATAYRPFPFSQAILGKYVYSIWIPRNIPTDVLLSKNQKDILLDLSDQIANQISTISKEWYIFIKTFKEDISTYNEKGIIKNNAFNLIQDNLSKLDYSIYDIKHYCDFISPFIFNDDFKNVDPWDWMYHLPSEKARREEFLLLAIDFLRKDR